MQTRTCLICGKTNSPSGRWFLLAENGWEDKLTILDWNDHLASHGGLHQPCSVGHVQQLVVHWMTTGSLDYPFAQPVPVKRMAPLGSESHGIRELEFGVRPIGELTVHRESMQRVLSESPHSLKTILDALLAALRRDDTEMPRDPELENVGIQAVAWEI